MSAPNLTQGWDFRLYQQFLSLSIAMHGSSTLDIERLQRSTRGLFRASKLPSMPDFCIFQFLDDLHGGDLLISRRM